MERTSDLENFGNSIICSKSYCKHCKCKTLSDIGVYVCSNSDICENIVKNVYDYISDNLVSDDSYATHGAFISIRACGLDDTIACKFVEELYRGYVKMGHMAEHRVSSYTCLPGEYAGFSLITFIIHGDDAYDMLLKEKGLHVCAWQVSDDKHKRSYPRLAAFAKVNVMPSNSGNRLRDRLLRLEVENNLKIDFRKEHVVRVYTHDDDIGLKIIKGV